VDDVEGNMYPTLLIDRHQSPFLKDFYVVMDAFDVAVESRSN
jgi:hypothetical protein